jgi:hypothetical protein
MSVRCFPAPKGLLLPRAVPLLRELGLIGEAAQQDEPSQRAVSVCQQPSSCHARRDR